MIRLNVSFLQVTNWRTLKLKMTLSLTMTTVAEPNPSYSTRLDNNIFQAGVQEEKVLLNDEYLKNSDVCFKS